MSDAPNGHFGDAAFEQAVKDVEQGRCERIASPGKWKVWREGGKVLSEVARAAIVERPVPRMSGGDIPKQ